MTKRLAIFTTHPIQYQAPWFRALAAARGLTIKVFFSYLPDEIEQGAGFGINFRWNIPLLDGYDYAVLDCRHTSGIVPAFARHWARGIGPHLDLFGADAALILGWQEVSLVQALAMCRIKRVPIILRGESNGRRPRPWAVSMAHRIYFAQCDAFLAIGDANAAFYRLAGVSGERIVLAPYFVDNARFSESADALRENRLSLRRGWGIADNATCFLFVGKLEPKKCVLHFLEGLRGARDLGANVHGLVVGAGEQMNAAQSLVEDARLPVTFAGFLNQTEISRAYVAGDALVLPSDFGETWGLVVNEAMAAGLPAVVSDRVGCAHDLVVGGKTGVVFRFGDTLALTGIMENLARDAELRRALGQHARDHVMHHFSIARGVDATRDAIVRATARSLGSS